MKEIGHGVYLMDNANELGHGPQELSVSPGYLGGSDQEKVAEVLIGFSVRHNAWVGVDWEVLCDEVRGFVPPNVGSARVKVIGQMLKARLLRIPGKRRWWGILNPYPLVICPTRLLIATIWGHQQS